VTATVHDATQVRASWPANSVRVYLLPTHDLALTFAKASAPAKNVVSGSNLATFRKPPSARDVKRVKPCM
jgi:hypothetical protein